MKLKISAVLLCLSFFGFTFSQQPSPAYADDTGLCTYTYTFTVQNTYADDDPSARTVEVRIQGEFEDGHTFGDYARTSGGEEAIQPGETGTLVVSDTTPLSWADNTAEPTETAIVITQTFVNSCDDDSDGGDDDSDDDGEVGSGEGSEFSDFIGVGRVVRSLRWGGDEYGFVVTNYNAPYVDALELSPEFLAGLPQAPETNTEFAVSEDGLTRFYVLTTGEFQVNFGPDFEGKVRVVVFDRGFNVTNRYEFNVNNLG